MVNQKKSYSKTNYLKNFIKYNSLSGSKANMFQYNSNCTDIHEIHKFRVFMELIKRDFIVFTEVEFKKNLGRCDLLCFDKKGEGHIFEIVNSESEESINKKLDKYPIDFEVHLIYCNKNLEEQVII